MVLLLAAGTAVVALTLIVSRELETRLTRDAQGIDLVVGAKGSPLQLVLAGVYHVDVPPGNIPLDAVAELRAQSDDRQRDPAGARRQLPQLPDRRHRARAHRALRRHGSRAVRCGRSRWRPCWAAKSHARPALDVGGRFTGSHGLAEGGGEHGDAPYTVVGVLAPTGTVLDRMVLTSIESVWAVHDAHHPEEPEEEARQDKKARAAERHADRSGRAK